MKINATMEPGRRFCDENGVELMEKQGNLYLGANGYGCVFMEI